MKVNDYIHIFAGSLIIISLSLGTWVHGYWNFLALFVGLNLFQYGFSGFCPMALILKKVGISES